MIIFHFLLKTLIVKKESFVVIFYQIKRLNYGNQERMNLKLVVVLPVKMVQKRKKIQVKLPVLLFIVKVVIKELKMFVTIVLIVKNQWKKILLLLKNQKINNNNNNNNKKQVIIFVFTVFNVISLPIFILVFPLHVKNLILNFMINNYWNRDIKWKN